jgi:uncharacterized protein (DUF885 family)
LLISDDELKAEAQRVARSSSPDAFQAWAANEFHALAALKRVDVAGLCPPDQVDWFEVYRRLI